MLLPARPYGPAQDPPPRVNKPPPIDSLSQNSQLKNNKKKHPITARCYPLLSSPNYYTHNYATMEPLKSGDSHAPALLTNLEVMELLQERLEARSSDASSTPDGNKKVPSFESRDWIEQTVYDYLKSSPAGSSEVKLGDMPNLVKTLRREPSAAASDALDVEVDESTTDNLKGYGLTTAETLQVLNHLPTSLVELHLLIEDLEKRIPEEEKQMEFLRLLAQYSGLDVEETAGGDEEEDEEEEADDMEE